MTIDLVPLHLATDTTDQEADIGDLVNQLRGLSLHANVPQITVIISSLIARLEETRGSVDLDDNVRFLFTVALQEITNFAGRAGTLLLANFLLQNAANPTAAADVITQGLRAAIDSASEVAGFDIGLFVALVLRLKAFGADAEF